MKRKHTPKKGGAVGAMPPTHYLSKPGQRGGGGARGSRIQGPGPPPPPGVKNTFFQKDARLFGMLKQVVVRYFQLSLKHFCLHKDHTASSKVGMPPHREVASQKYFFQNLNLPRK